MIYQDLGWTCQDLEDLGGFGTKIHLKVSKKHKQKSIYIYIYIYILKGVVVLAGEQTPEAAFFGRHILGLAYLIIVKQGT